FQSPPYHVIQVFQSPPYHVIQVFQSPPWTQVYTIKPLGMQTASTNIGERMGRSQELSDSKRGPVIGGHLGNKSIRDISWLLNIPRSTVSGIITKWKPPGTTATQPPSGRPRHMTGRGQRMLKRTDKCASGRMVQPSHRHPPKPCGRPSQK
ncbi:unnamed protein product, partial [Staurois parvus]